MSTKLKKKVITFKKIKRNHTWESYHEICGSSITCIAFDIAKKYGGFICSFRDKNNFDLLKCKLVIRISEDAYGEFVSDFINAFNGYIEKIRW
jgi:hypothetical protein